MSISNVPPIDENGEVIDNVETPPQPQQSQDPVVEFLTHLQFQTNLFDELRVSFNDPEKYTGYLKAPDLYVLMNMIWILKDYDPNREIPEGQKDHLAFVNLLKWLLMKFAGDPVWISYIGWFGRMYGCCQHPSSYWPLTYSDCFSPKGFFKRGQVIDINEENKKVRDPSEVFKWSDDFNPK